MRRAALVLHQHEIRAWLTVFLRPSRSAIQAQSKTASASSSPSISAARRQRLVPAPPWLKRCQSRTPHRVTNSLVGCGHDMTLWLHPRQNHRVCGRFSPSPSWSRTCASRHTTLLPGGPKNSCLYELSPSPSRRTANHVPHLRPALIASRFAPSGVHQARAVGTRDGPRNHATTFP